MTAVVEALSFFGRHDPVARGTGSCICYDSTRVVGVCFGHDSGPHTRSVSTSACQQIDAGRPTQVTAYHAARVMDITGNCG